MTHPHRPDLFTNVHKGIRRALFAACTALGRAEGDEGERSARALLAQTLHFVAHHGDNEDVLLLPLVRDRSPEVFARMSEAHGALDAERERLSSLEQPLADLYLAACAFTSRYLAHLDDEERALEPLIRAALSPEEAAQFGRRSVERTAPADQSIMLGWMLPAMTPREAAAFLERLPPAMASELRTLLEAAA